MDDRVIRSMARWPDVPAVFGWLALDGRGRWLLRSETITHQATLSFIARNYAHDEFGRWYFQNGPQRVFVELHATPWVFRLQPDGQWINHIEQPVACVSGVFIDDNGALLLDTPEGVGCVDDRDLQLLSGALLGGDGAALDEDSVAARLDLLTAGKAAELAVRIAGVVLPLRFVRAQSIPARFRFVRVPHSNEDEAELTRLHSEKATN